MTSPLITYETAVLAKEKGFAVPSNLYYDQEKKLCRTHKNLFVNNNHHSQSYSAPTQDLLQKWIRETHGWYVYPVMQIRGTWDFVIQRLDESIITGQTQLHALSADTYELALEEGLLRGLNLINKP